MMGNAQFWTQHNDVNVQESFLQALFYERPSIVAG
jgi:hypothetical protein